MNSLVDEVGTPLLPGFLAELCWKASISLPGNMLVSLLPGGFELDGSLREGLVSMLVTRSHLATVTVEFIS